MDAYGSCISTEGKKNMRFQVICRNKGDSLAQSWEESHNDRLVTNAAQAIEWAQRVIGHFNRTLRANEVEREVIGVKMGAGNAGLPHEWRKSNLVTQMGKDGGMSFDTYKCEHCDATGKRFGLSDNISRDKKFKDREFCTEEDS